MWSALSGAVPKALSILGLSSIDEYPEYREQQKIGKIYFIQAGEDGPIKIGFSKDVDARLDTLKVASPYPLILRRTIEGPREKEAELHEQFSHLRKSGEWFEPGDDLVRFILQ